MESTRSQGETEAGIAEANREPLKLARAGGIPAPAAEAAGEEAPGAYGAAYSEIKALRQENLEQRARIIELEREGTLLAVDLDRIDYKFTVYSGSPYDCRIGTVERWERLTGTDCEYKQKAGDREEAERAALCVNFCAGIPSDWLENGMLNHVADLLRAKAAEYQGMADRSEAIASVAEDAIAMLKDDEVFERNESGARFLSDGFTGAVDLLELRIETARAGHQLVVLTASAEGDRS